MKRLLRALLTFVGLALLCAGSSQAQESQSFFEKARAAAAAAKEKLVGEYSNDLRELAKMYEQAGDLTAKAAADAELERVGKTEEISGPSAVPLPSGVETLQTDYSRRLREAIVRTVHPLIAEQKVEIDRRKRDRDFATAVAMQKELDATREAFGIRPLSVNVGNKNILSHPNPVYPPEAKRKQISGKGVYLVDVDSISGKVTNAVVQKSAGHAILDNAALAALKRWRFQPHTVLEVEIPINFQITANTKQ